MIQSVTPSGLQPSAQGCRTRLPWVQRSDDAFRNPEGVASQSSSCDTRPTWVERRLNRNPTGFAKRETTMPQSLSAVYLHLVFSTKVRRPFVRDPVTRTALHAYLGGISKTLNCPPIIVGGTEDHVHVLARFGRTITQAEWVKELKRVSSGWLKKQGRAYRDFQWQAGYAAFSVSRSSLDRVRNYIADQETHHLKMDFQGELRSLLRKHDVEWDERLVWD